MSRRRNLQAKLLRSVTSELCGQESARVLRLGDDPLQTLLRNSTFAGPRLSLGQRAPHVPGIEAETLLFERLLRFRQESSRIFEPSFIKSQAPSGGG